EPGAAGFRLAHREFPPSMRRRASAGPRIPHRKTACRDLSLYQNMVIDVIAIRNRLQSATTLCHQLRRPQCDHILLPGIVTPTLHTAWSQSSSPPTPKILKQNGAPALSQDSRAISPMQTGFFVSTGGLGALGAC